MNIAKYLEPLWEPSQLTDGVPRMLSIGEYVAGFAPIGYYLASGRVAVSCAVTGVASKLISNGMSDAKVHNIPAIYLMGLNAISHRGRAPIQDTTPEGMNLPAQLRAELGDDCFIIDRISDIEPALERAQQALRESRPVVFGLPPDVTGGKVARPVDVPARPRDRHVDSADIEAFLRDFPVMAKGRRVVIFVGEEAAFVPGIQALTTRLSKVLQAPTVWSINGANAVASDNPCAYGYISFGGNDRSLDVWRKISRRDIVITLGFCAGEYSLALENVQAGTTWHIGAATRAYNQVDGGFRHRVEGEYRQVRGDIGTALEQILPRLEELGIERPTSELHTSLNTREIIRDVRSDCVDFMRFYEELPKYWRPHSIGFDDVCVSYKDRQYVTQRPHPNIKFWSLHHGSAMGSGFSMGVGAKLADPSLHTFMFCGDGCWRLFGGCLADVAKLDLRLFIINNGSYGVVRQGLATALAEVHPDRYHHVIPSVDFVGAARAHGWDGYRLAPDLSNLAEIMEHCYTRQGRSILVEVPMDVAQEIGPSRPSIWRRSSPKLPPNW
jgi:acetolactate synthase-1/2/3 large subunit